MAEEKQQPKQQQKPQQQQVQAKKPSPHQQLEVGEALVRILGYDIPGSKKIYPGLTRIKGISWTISNVVCLKLNIPHDKRISELSKEEIERIQSFFKDPQIKEYMKNRRFDFETGQTRHVLGTDLDMVKDFDIRRLKKIRSYKGIRHGAGLPVRGQRTRSHFRKKRTSTGIKVKAK